MQKSLLVFEVSALSKPEKKIERSTPLECLEFLAAWLQEHMYTAQAGPIRVFHWTLAWAYNPSVPAWTITDGRDETITTYQSYLAACQDLIINAARAVGVTTPPIIQKEAGNAQDPVD